jgi:hypothetical protein
MLLTKKFQEAVSSYAIKISSLETYRKYPIVKAETVTTKFGPTVLLIIPDSQYNTNVKVFVPKLYSSVFSDEDIESINSKKVSLNLIYKVLCEKKILHFIF